ncbi:MAG TPA: amidophosphoribosyltransferase [Candidatus Lustribacter sp.]|jgi:amidophosphoribosyltransferase|nr:amidophosphoribosyltransferase [Candidatus Lustribacter sp.]
MCGIAAVYAPGVDVARLVYFGLYALQHRGQESAGIAVGDGERLASHREMGLLTGVFNEEILSRLTGIVAMGHTRYSTSGSSIIVNAQPFMESTDIGPFAFGHNGNLTNAEALLDALPGHVELDATSDSEILAKTIALGTASTLVGRVKDAMAVAEGAYSVIMVTPDSVIAFRDPWGVRPLCIGTYGENGYMVASESCALSTVGAQYLREIEPGEVVVVDRNGMRSEHIEVVKPPALCMFEYIYFARPDSVLSGRSIYMARYQMGRALAREHPVDADVVMAVPDSAIPGGIGYAAESGVPYVEGLIKNRYIGRTFISPDQAVRNQGVQLKFNPIVENLRGQRVVVVDDSIVRGTTTPRIVSLLREAGAREVHLRITSPPIVHPCYLGVDMATYKELIAANLTVDQIRARVGADSLGYLSVERLVESTGRERSDFCLGCLTGAYPSAPVMATPGADRQPALKL